MNAKPNPTDSQTINERAIELCESAIGQAEELEIKVLDVGGAKVLDFATGREGTLLAGVHLSNICMGGLGVAEISENKSSETGLSKVVVDVASPLHGCIGSQYAGWPVSHADYFAMCSGPMRMLRGKEEILTEYKLDQAANVAVGVMETNVIPSSEVVEIIAGECKVDPANLVLCVARTASFPGSVQIVARSVETAMHKLHELKFDLATIKSGTGSSPLPPIASDDMTALGWTNDSILYGTQVDLTVETDDTAIESILEQIPSSSSSDFGTPFLEIFNRYEKDFYKIDKMLFSPAKIRIHNLSSGKNFESGELRLDLLKSSFGIS